MMYVYGIIIIACTQLSLALLDFLFQKTTHGNVFDVLMAINKLYGIVF